MKKIVILAMGMMLSSTALAQEEIETSISGDVVSSYIWRGMDAGSVSLQPTFGVGYKGLSLTAWGSYGLTDPADTKEFDLTLGYRTICLKPTSATTSALRHCNGSPTSPATTA